MPSRKRNEYLEPEVDDEDILESEEDQEFERSKAQLASRSIKRRKLDDGSESEDAGCSDSEEMDKALAAGARSTDIKTKSTAVQDSRFSRVHGEDEDREEMNEEEDDDDGDADQYPTDDDPAGASEKRTKALTSDQLNARAKAKKKTGVIYISRIPPFMKPQTVRSYLSPYGEIGKLFLTPEDHATYMRRKKSGGNKKHSYVDGWVEFLSKKDAKMVASVLNGNNIGGKKGNYYHDDIWNIKYLNGFKWDDLTEQIQRENKEREARLRTEISKAKRENEAFVRDVEKGKMFEGIKAKRKEADEDAAEEADNRRSGGKMIFKQNMVKDKRKPKEDVAADDRAGRVLSKVL
ncbi:pre-rRNA-processing protein ESF2 [Elsinoe australis]|uniref:18S rRNA factor 2 n=1 Tax=Elsinoe australis TaxID=40998 RepID=A0A4U7AU62_9PEZI|nr:pre-rRNA-processing protein ESF2 [Elsinoe australis]